MAAETVTAETATGVPADQPVSPSAWRMLADTWRQRRLIPWFAGRMIIKLYALTRLGRSWIVLRPALTLLGGTILFGTILQTDTGGPPYLLFLIAGMSAWTAFDRTVFWSTKSLERYTRLWRSFHFPMLVVPIGGAGLAYVEVLVYGAIGLIAVVVYALIDGQIYLQLGPELLIGVAGLLLACTFGIGLGLLLSLLNMKGRDTIYSLRYGLQLWLYVTPVLYPVAKVPPALEFISVINPMAPIVELAQYGFLGDEAAQIRPGPLLLSIGITAVVVAAGLVLFARRAHWAYRDIYTYDRRQDEGIEA